MKLEGSLDAFSLPDIFQLLSYTKKTGGLRLVNAGARGVVYFTDGAVTGAAAEGGRQTLARRLVGAGLLDDGAVSAAVVEATGSSAATNGGGVVAALLRSGATSTDIVSPIAFDQAHDAVFELLRWPSGDFTFVVDETNPDDVGLRLAPDEVVTRAGEQRVRWEAAASVVPSPDSVPALRRSTDPELVVRGTDWAVLRLVDGRRRVSEIVDLAGAGQFATVVTLADMVERGLVEVRAADRVDAVNEIARRLALLEPAESADAPVNAVTDGPFDAAPGEPLPATDVEIDVSGSAVTSVGASAHADPIVTSSPDGELSTFNQTAPVELPDVVVPLEITTPDAAGEATTAEPTEPAESEPPLAPAASTVVTVTDESAAPLPGPSASQPRLGGAHVPGDVVPPREEPFMPSRQPAYAEPARPAATRGGGGGAALATATASDSLIERDPSVNRSLLLRLIAGVRGL